MNKEKEAFWFPAKKYGFGWGLPTAWQGWVVFIGYLLLTTVGAILLTNRGHIPWLLLYVFTLTIMFVLVCWKKGEKLK